MIALLLLPLLAQQASAQEWEASVVEEVAAETRRLAAEDRFSGVVLLARCDTSLLLLAVNERDRARHLPVLPTTAFRVASMTKMFTGIAIAQLREAGKLRFTDTVSRLAPALPPTFASRMTVDQLLTHTSGLGSIWTTDFRHGGGAAFHSPRDYYPLFVNQPLRAAPGTRWIYSNAGYVVLGDLIEQITGSYRQYVRTHVFAPAGMSLEPLDEISRATPNRAIAYTGQDRTPAESIGLFRLMPAGGAVFTASDMWRFAQALLSHKLLSPQMTGTVLQGRVQYRATASYGYGFANELVNGQVVVFHDGGADGVSTNLDIYPATGHVAIVLSNFDPPAMVPIRDLIRTRLTSTTGIPKGTCAGQISTPHWPVPPR